MRINLIIISIILFILASSYFYWHNNKTELFYHTENHYGPVWVYDSKNVRCMSFSEPPSKVLQSCMYIDNSNKILFNSIKMFLSTLFFNEDPRKILIIGLGGASLPRALKFLTPNAEINIVENNPALPEIVEKYFDYSFDDTNKIFVVDGVDYVKNSASNRYDLIMINVFDSEYIPEGFLTDEFMQNAKRILTDNGIIAMNTFRRNDKNKRESDLFKKHFQEYYSIVKKNTRLLIATKIPGKLPGYDQIAINSNLWTYRMSELGINHTSLASLYKGALVK